MPKYDSYENIPAKVFFKIIKTKDYQLMKPKPKEQGLEELFSIIYDEWFIKSENDKAKDFLLMRNELACLHNKLLSLNSTLEYLFNNKHIMTKEMYLELIEAMQIGYGVYFNTDVDFYDEMKRVLHEEIGCIKDDIAFKEAELKELTGDNDGKEFNYYAIVDGIANTLAPRIINADMSLAEFVEAERSAIRKSLKQTA